MTENEARNLLEQDVETNEDTREFWSLNVLDVIGKTGNGYVFNCIEDGVNKDDYTILPKYAVFPDGTILVVPIDWIFNRFWN